MNKIRVIDLLNKIANGEELPKIIKVMGGTYYLCEDDQSGCCYFSEKQGFGGVKLGFDTSVMNEEVEIIEEDKKLKKIKIEYSPDIEEKIFYEDGDKPNHCILGDTGTGLLINKINELIDKVNNMENN